MFRLNRVLTKTVLNGLFLCGILYCSMIDVALGYNGHLSFTVGGVVYENVDLQFTGVQLWSFGFSLTYVVYVLGWVWFLNPADTFFSRLLIRHLPETCERVAFFTTESSAATIAFRGNEAPCFIPWLVGTKFCLIKRLFAWKHSSRIGCLLILHITLVFLMTMHLNFCLLSTRSWHTYTMKKLIRIV